MKRPILGSHFPKLTIRAMAGKAGMAQNQQDGEVAFPVGVGKWKARFGLVREKLGASTRFSGRDRRWNGRNEWNGPNGQCRGAQMTKLRASASPWVCHHYQSIANIP